MKAIAFSWLKNEAKRQENDKNDFHIRKANFRMSEIFDFLHFICTRLDVEMPSAPKAGPPAVATFARKKIFHIKRVDYACKVSCLEVKAFRSFTCERTDNTY